MRTVTALQLSLHDGLLAALDAAWERGEAVMVLDPTLSAQETQRRVALAGPGRIVDRYGEHRTVDGSSRRVPEDSALVVSTSGSTGTPKAVLLTHAALRASVDASRRRLGAADGVPWLGVLPLHHVAGVSVVLRSRAAGREPRLHDVDSREVVDDAEPSWISLVPTQLERLLAAGADLSRHAGVLLGGGPAGPGLLARATEAGVRLHRSYGSTETCGGCVYDGVPLDGTEARVSDGVLELRGPTLAAGVLTPDGLEPVAGEDGWLRTNDLATIEDGVVRIIGRADDVVVSGGENVPLSPVREAVAALDIVAQSAVVGLEDERWGTAVTAVIVPSGPPPSLAELRDALRPRLAPYHLPTRLLVVDELPRDAMGKVTPVSVRENVIELH